MSTVSLLSCSKGEYNSGDGQVGKNPFQTVKPGVATSGTFTAKLNGSQYTADNDKARAYSVTVSGITSWSIIGAKSSKESFALTVNKSTLNKATYDVATFDATIMYIPVGGGSAVVGTSGSVTITDISDTRLKGTFTMQASGFDVTEGSFDLPITTN